MKPHMNVNDQRLKSCVASCSSVDQVLVDLGFGEKLVFAKKKEWKLIQESLHGTLANE